MNATRPGTPRWRFRRLAWIAAGIGAALLLAFIATGWLLQPQRAGRFLLARAGNSLGLEIEAGGIDYRLRGTPQLVLRNLVARRPGDASAMLRAERVFVSLPWSTLRARGDDLTAQRIELDAPVLDLPALQRWQATRPPGQTRIPTLRDGLHVRGGRIANDDWTVDGLAIEMPALHPDRALRARVRGRYLDPPLAIPADLEISLANPAQAMAGQATGIAATGKVTAIGDGWQVPARVYLSGPLRIGKDSALVKPVRLGIAARYRSANTEAPFRLGLHGPMAFNNATWRFVPVQLVLDGDGAIPDAGARGSMSVGRRFALRLDGRIAAWPDAWPALPRPLSASDAPMPFELDYAGPLDFTDVTHLRLQRDDADFDARFRLPVVTEWINGASAGSPLPPLPPLQGRLRTPRVEIAGASLEGVEVEFDDPALPATDDP